MRSRHLVVAALAALAMAYLFWPAESALGGPEDEKALRQSAAAYAEAFNKGDVKAVLTYWAADAEFVNEDGVSFKGHDQIAAQFRKALENLKGHKLKLHVGSIKFFKSDVALETGRAELIAPDGSSEMGPYEAVWVKTNGKWLLSRVRDLPSEGEVATTNHQGALKQLAWLVGEWSAEGKEVSVSITSKWAEGKNYLLQEYVIRRKGEDPHYLSQRIGYDASQGVIRSWTFDANGGFGGGYWQREGNKWTVSVGGVLADGRLGSSLDTWKYVDDNNWTWSSAQREVDGQPVPDSEVKFTRKTGK
jgi:uncharacterized protein (TIGR02246 family)